MSFGSVPTMNHSSTLGPDVTLSPVHGSILTRTSPSAGFGKLVTGHLALASLRKPCQTKVETSIEKSGARAVDTRLLSELPFHTPTARA